MSIADLEEYMRQEARESLLPELAKIPQMDGRGFIIQEGPTQSEGNDWAIGIYLGSPDGAVYESDGNAFTAHIVIDCMIDKAEKDAGLGVACLSTTLEWLKTHGFEVNIYPAEAIVLRVGGGDFYNGFAVHIVIAIIDYMTDYRR